MTEERDPRGVAAAHELPHASAGAADSEGSLEEIRAGTRVIELDPPARSRRWLPFAGLAAASVLVIVAVAILVTGEPESTVVDQPVPSTEPVSSPATTSVAVTTDSTTAPASTPAPATTTAPDSSAATTPVTAVPTTVASPTTVVAPRTVAISYLDLPPPVEMTQPFARIEIASSGLPPVAAVDGGVVVVDETAGEVILVQAFDEAPPRRVPLGGPAPFIVTAGPGDVLYGFARTPSPADEYATSMVAYELRSGSTVASREMGTLPFPERTRETLGHGPTGVIDRITGNELI